MVGGLEGDEGGWLFGGYIGAVVGVLEGGGGKLLLGGVTGGLDFGGGGYCCGGVSWGLEDCGGVPEEEGGPDESLDGDGDSWSSPQSSFFGCP